MHILAIETTDWAGSVALLDDDKIIESCRLPSHPRSAATLAPALDALFQSTGVAPANVKLVGVATGPGSFTGLRVGVATAKLFAYAVQAKIIGVNTLEVIAEQVPAQFASVWAVLDAQRNQLFAAQFRRGPGQNWVTSTAAHIVDDDVLVAQLSPPTAVSGPATERLSTKLPSGVTVIDHSHWSPRAETIGTMAWRRFRTGASDDLWQLAPQYFRRSAAEEKLAARLERVSGGTP